MTTVRIVDGAGYGFRIVGLVFGLLVVSGALFTLGGLLATGGDLTLSLAFGEPLMLAGGGFFGLAGVVVLYAGTVGLVHKVIADSVATGFENADVEVATTAPAAEAPESVERSTPAPDADRSPAASLDDVSRAEPDRAEEPADPRPAAEAGSAESEPVTDRPGSTAGKVDPEAVDLVEDPTPKPGTEGSTAGPTATADESPPEAESGPDQIESDPEPAVETAAGDGPTESTDTVQSVADPEPATTDGPTEVDREPPTAADIDRAVTEATGSDLGENGADEADDEGTGTDAAVTSEAEDEPVPLDEDGDAAGGPTNEATGPMEVEKADMIDRAFEDEDEFEAAGADPHTVIDDAIEEGDVEDTTDEPGDWEPLDESDLKD